MGSASKRSKKSQTTDSGSEDFEDMDDLELAVSWFFFLVYSNFFSHSLFN